MPVTNHTVTTAPRPSAGAISADTAEETVVGRHCPVAEEERHCMIATAAYYRAAHRGFAPGHELEDWLEAETEVERQLGCT